MEGALGARIRELRQARGWSQEQVAQRMRSRGFHQWRQSTVAKSEAAERPIRVNEVYALARAFDESITGLLNEPGRGGAIHGFLVALDTERVAEANHQEAVERTEVTREALDAARAMVVKAMAATNEVAN